MVEDPGQVVDIFLNAGVGISIAANKVKGIRCVCCSEPYSALLSRRHNDTNMLAMGSRVVGRDLALMIIDQWLSGTYEGGRHQIRLDEIRAIEKKRNHPESGRMMQFVWGWRRENGVDGNCFGLCRRNEKSFKA